MNTNKIASLLFFLVTAIVSAQNNFSVKGKTLSAVDKKPIESATVYLTSANDSTMIDYTISDKNGSFIFSVKKQTKPFIVKVSSIGYEIFQKEFKSLEANLDLGEILINYDVTTLGEVVIVTEAPPVRIKNDTLEFNASSFKVRPDANVEALLKQLPGVEIDSEGKITVNGKEVNQILVNGKPFFDKDGKIALQNLPSEIINKVQITDTKSKKEEISGDKASSNNASINLTIDEDKNKGFFGKFMGGYGSDERYESSFLVNYFKNKRKISVLASSNNINSTGFSMNEIFDSMGGGRNNSIYTSDNGSFGINGMRFGGGAGITVSNMVGLNYADEWINNLETNGSYFYTDANSKNNNRTKQINLRPTGNFTTESNSTTVDDKFAHNFNYNFEYKIDSTASVYVSPKFVKAKSKYSKNLSEFSTNESDQIANESVGKTFDETDNLNFANSIYFYKSFKKKGRSIEASFENDNTKEDLYSLNNTTTTFYSDTDNDGMLDDSTTDARNQILKNRKLKDTYSAEFSYFEPVTDSLKVGFTLQYKNEKTSENRDGFDFDASSNEYSLRNELLTNYLASSTNTVNPYMRVNMTKKDFYFGLNMGTAISKFESSSLYLNNNTNLVKNYVLPSAGLYGNYKFTKSKSIWMNYGYQVDFASPNQILPVADLSNALNTYIGNPDLDPNKSHYAYLSFRDYDFATKTGFNFYAGGNFYDSQIISSTTFDESNKRTTTYKNVAGTMASWFGGNWNKSFKNEAHSYKFGIGANGGYDVNKGFTDGQLFDAKSVRFTPRLSFNYDYGDLISLNPTYNFTYRETKYTNYILEKASNFTHKFNLQATTYFPKNFVFGNDFGYTYNSNIADGFKKDFYLWNTSLGYNFLNKTLLAKVKVYDVLNQNLSTTRTISATTIRDEENDVLKRYVMFSLTYKIEKFAGKEKKGGGIQMF